MRPESCAQVVQLIRQISYFPRHRGGRPFTLAMATAKKRPQKRAAESSAATKTSKKSKTEAAPPPPAPSSTLNAAYLGQVAAWLETIVAHSTFKDAKDLPMDKCVKSNKPANNLFFVRLTHLNQPGVPILMKNIKLLKDHFLAASFQEALRCA